jgi:hypothetical protein
MISGNHLFLCSIRLQNKAYVVSEHLQLRLWDAPDKKIFPTTFLKSLFLFGVALYSVLSPSPSHRERFRHVGYNEK